MQISAIGYQTPGAVYTKDSLEEAKAYEKAMTTYSAEAVGVPAEKETVAKNGVIADNVNISDQARALAQASVVPKIDEIKDDEDSADFGGTGKNGESENSQQRTLQPGEEGSGSVQYGGAAGGEGSGSDNTVEKLRKQIQEVEKQIRELQAKIQESTQEVKDAEDQSAQATSAQTEMEAAQLELNALNAQLLTLQKALMDAMKEG